MKLSMIGSRRIVAGLAAAGLAAALVGLLPTALSANTTSGRWETPLPAVALGVIIGLTYGLLGVGLVLIYKSNRVINFAHGAIGAFVAATLGVFVTSWHIPYWLGFAMALLVAALVGTVAELAIIRRLRSAPNIMSVVATLGLGQFLVAFAYTFNGSNAAGHAYPEPAGLPTIRLGSLLITPAYTGMLIFAPLSAIGLALFLNRSRFGLALRGAAANSESAKLSGVFPSRTSMLAWAIAGVFAGITAMLVQPAGGYVDQGTASANLLLPALAAAAIARMSSISTALVAGVALGILDQLLLWNYPSAHPVELAFFLVILAAFLLQRRQAGRSQDKASWAVVQAMRPLPEELRKVWTVRLLRPGCIALSLLVGVLLPLTITNQSAATLTEVIAFAIVGVSVALVTGLAGQLTLGQFALAAIGGTAAYIVNAHGGGFIPSLFAGGAAGGAASMIVGFPALRLRGFVLAVTTLAFSSMTNSWLLSQRWMLGAGVVPRTPSLFGHRIQTAHAYYYVALTALVLVFGLAHNLRRSALGLKLVAVRDNEENARAFSISPRKVKSQAFLIAGFIAGIGGGIFASTLPNLDANTFSLTIGGVGVDLAVVTMTVVGGISLLSGPLVGALLVLGLPAFVSLSTAALAASQFGLLVIILYAPRGIIQALEPARNRIAVVLANLSLTSKREPSEREAPPSVVAGVLPGLGPSRNGRATGSVILLATHLTKSYGGVSAVDDVSLSIQDQEIVGLIGPNGAGKTTTFELLGGFARRDKGTVAFLGSDVTDLPPERRSQRGLVRSFQDAALFPTLTVEDAIRVALERRNPTTLAASLAFGAQRGAAHNGGDLETILRRFGLGRYRTHEIRELSTGTRRIAELACLIALQPKVLLLDEPSSGIAQRETPALAELLRGLRDELGITLVVIEHDMQLITSIADRLVVMVDGRILVSGSPDEIRRDPRVAFAFFGGQPRPGLEQREPLLTATFPNDQGAAM